MPEFPPGFCLAVALAWALSIPVVSVLLPPSGRATAAGAADSAGMQLVRLRRRKAKDIGGHSSSSAFYTARVFVGQPRPQALHLAFDTASGQVILPSADCSSAACREHRKYRPEVSALAVDINADGTLVQDGQRLATGATTRDAISIGFSSLDLGDGTVTGHFVADAVCLQTESAMANHTGLQRDAAGRPTGAAWPSAACAEVGLVAATELSDTPFRAAPYDGSIGLGMQGLSIRRAFSFIETLGAVPAAGEKGNLTMSEHTPLKQFALYHGRRFGEAAFGGHNPKRLASPLEWTPVHKPEEGYWQVPILGIRIGNLSLSACRDGSCRGIIDSCTSKLGAPSKMMPDFKFAFSRLPPFRQVDNSCVGPDLHLELAGGIELTLRAEDYARNTGTATVECELAISPLELPDSFAGVFILGEPLLRRYYTVFDWSQGSERIGFGLAADVERDGLEESIVAATEAAEDLEDTMEAAMASLPPEQEDQVLPVLLQALLIRVTVVICMVMFGTHIVSTRSLFTCLESILAYRGLLLEVAEFAPVVPSSEAPDGDECVICLGSCEDDPHTVRGVPGLQHAYSAEEGGCNSGKCSLSPRWRRLRCGHHFHETCIFEWLRKARQCPVCRRNLKEGGVGTWANARSRSFGGFRFPLLDVVHGGVMAVSQTQ